MLRGILQGNVLNRLRTCCDPLLDTPLLYSPVFIYKLLEFAEAAMIASTLSVGLVATGTAAIKGTEPPDFSTFVVAIQPPYESDDKRIYPEILKEIVSEDEALQD